jgi:hypothetical protein
MRRSLRFLLALALVLPLGFPLGARADIGASLMLQSDARERGLSYSAGRPSASLSPVRGTERHRRSWRCLRPS